ncbi:ADP-ribosylglycohydrolase family protein [Sphaerisporangium sp. NBC_01403]
MTIDPMHKWCDLALPYDSRVRGCLFGGAIGDALGSAVEFMSLPEIRSAYGSDGIQDLLSSKITNDTQMTLFTAEGLIRSHLQCANLVTSVRDAYDRWFDTQQVRRPMLSDEGPRTGWLREQAWLYARPAPGSACLSGLQSGRGSLELPAPGAIGIINPGSKGCGTVMRSALFGLLPYDRLNRPRVVPTSPTDIRQQLSPQGLSR